MGKKQKGYSQNTYDTDAYMQLHTRAIKHTLNMYYAQRKKTINTILAQYFLTVNTLQV